MEKRRNQIRKSIDNRVIEEYTSLNEHTIQGMPERNERQRGHYSVRCAERRQISPSVIVNPMFSRVKGIPENQLYQRMAVKVI